MNNNLDPFGINQNNNPVSSPPDMNVNNGESFNLNQNQPMPNAPIQGNMAPNEGMAPMQNMPNAQAPIMPEQNINPMPEPPIEQQVSPQTPDIQVTNNPMPSAPVSPVPNEPVSPMPEANQNFVPPVNTPQQPVDNSQVINNNQNTYADQALIDAFIDKNADKIKNGKFNIGAFIFGGLYLLYRKMFLYALLLLIIEVVISSVSKIAALGFIVNILLALFVNKLYLNFANKKVSNIKAKNPNLSQSELVELCKRKGGTSIGMVIGGLLVFGLIGVIIGVILALTVGLSMLSGLVGDMGNFMNSATHYYNDVLYGDPSGDLNYTFAEGYESSTESFSAEYKTDGEGLFNTCSARIGKTAEYIEPTELIKKISEDESATPGNPIVINNITWQTYKYEVVGENYVYTTSKDNKSYMFIFDIGEDANRDYCLNKLTETLNSISFK